MKRLLFVVVSLLVVLHLPFPARGQVVISEFMADNTRTLIDEDGESPDWIEIRNVSDSAVNLLDWSLTDNAGDPARWRFPATNINAGAYMVVFASGKDRRTPGRPLHTSFGLDPDGEYLALVKPDRTTITTRFSPVYPRQAPNVSFGFGSVSSNVTLLTAGAPAFVLVPTAGNGGSTLGDAWKGGTEPFNDGAWTPVVTGIGFSSGPGTALVAAANMVLRFNFDAAPVGNVIVDSKPVGVARNGTAAAGTPWVPASTDSSATPISRNGVMQFVVPLNSMPTNQITVPANADFNSPQGTIAFWMRSLGASGPGTGPTILFDRQTITAPPSSVANGGVIVQNLDGTLSLLAETNALTAVETTTTGSTADDRWHHVAVAYDQMAGGSTRIYIDGQLNVTGTNLRGWTWPTAQQLELGRSHVTRWRRYNGFLDDFRIYNRALTPAEVSQIYTGDGGVDAADIASNIGASMLGVNSSAFIRVPFNVGATDAFSLLTLRLKYDDGFAAWLNGQLIASDGVTDPLNLPFNAAATTTHASSLAQSIPVGNPARFLRQGENILAIQGVNLSATDGTFLVLPELIGSTTIGETANPVFLVQPTPGAPNVGGTATVGPLITDVGHIPNVPLDYEDVLVTARSDAAFAPVSNLTLTYKIMYSPDINVPMNDGGTNGDRVAGDGLWTGLIPADASTNGQMIRYYVTARDLIGTPSRWPLFNNPTNSEQYLGTIVDPTNVTSKLPIFHVFFPPAQSNAAGTETGTRCSFFYDGEFYDNVRIELRGNTSAGFDKKAYRLEFNRDHKLRHPGPGERISDTSLLGEWADPGYFRQAFSFWLLDAFGTPSPFDYPVRLQLNGEFFMLAMHSDVMGEEQLARMGYDTRGALYKAAGQVVRSEASTGVFDKRTRLFEDHSDYYALTDDIVQTNPARGTNIFDILDIPQIINYLVCARWVTEADDVWANMTLYRDTENDQLWRIIPFDMNVSWGQLYCSDNAGAFNTIIATNDNFKSHPFYGGTNVLVNNGGNWNRMYDVIIRTPATREMLTRRMRSLMDTLIQSPETPAPALIFEQKLTEFTNAIWAEAFLDRQKWSFPICSGNRGPYCWGCTNWLTNHIAATVNQYIVPRRKHWFVTHSITNTAKPLAVAFNPPSALNNFNAGIPLSQPTNALISVVGVEYNPPSGNQLEEYICLTNANPYAMDISGWKLGGGVDFTFIAGTVMPSNSVLYVSPNTRVFRNRATAPRGGMGLFVVGPYQGQLSARGEPLTITDNTGRLVYTNSFIGNPSGPQQFLRITEIMYNPSPLAGNTNDAQEFEYLELKNISASTTIGLAGVRFVNGITFDFTGSAVTSLAPGERVLVVKNLAAFTARYGPANVAGQYASSLDNAGERLQLIDAVNEEIHDFSYNNSWYPITDGQGFSLVVVDEAGDTGAWDRSEGWRPSGVINGAPGQIDPPTPSFANIIVSEVLTHTDLPLVDAIELHNPTASPVDLSGWFLSDDFGTPRKYRITNGCVIAAGGYLAFDENLFNNTNHALVPFALSSTGDEVWLFSGDANTNLTGYVFGEDYGAAATDVSFGRYVNSQTNVHFVAQSSNSLDGPNAGPRVGPVVISEIMYHPPDFADGRDNSRDEYIELQNVTGTAVPLFNPNAPADTWRLRGGIEYNFPPGVTLPGNGLLLLVSFNTLEARMLAAFRARYDVPPEVPVYGPYRGQLDNSSADLRLERPDDPLAGDVPYIRMDRVEYEDSVPWPAGADGNVPSLQRRGVAAYGNDPTNWVAVAPSAGRPHIPGGTPPGITTQPANTTGIVGRPVSLSVEVSGTPPFFYQWRFNDKRLDGANSRILGIPAMRSDLAGTYNVVVFNSAGSVESANAQLNVVYPPNIGVQPTNRAVWIKPDSRAVTTPEGTNVTFVVGATSLNTGLRYQWVFNGTNLLNATNASLTVTNVQVEDEGDYFCLVSDSVDTVTSVTAHLTPLIQPIIIQPPLGQTVVEGSDFSHGVEVIGNPAPFGYSWRRALPSGTIISNYVNARSNLITLNSTAAGLVLASGIASSNYEMRLVVFNEANPSPGILLRFTNTVVADFDRDGVPDTVENALGLAPNDPADGAGDLDGDGMNNRAEYIAGTDPVDPASYLKITSVTPGGGGATLTFGAISNKTYTIQYTESLGSGAWSKLKDLVASRTNRIETVLDPAFTTNRYYRVATPFVP